MLWYVIIVIVLAILIMANVWQYFERKSIAITRYKYEKGYFNEFEYASSLEVLLSRYRPKCNLLEKETDRLLTQVRSNETVIQMLLDEIGRLRNGQEAQELQASEAIPAEEDNGEDRTR